MFIPKSVVLIISDLKNLPAGISTPATFNASALVAVPYTLGKNPPANCSISAVVCGSATLIPDLITVNPVTIVLGVKLSFEIIITGMSAMYKDKINLSILSLSAIFSTTGPYLSPSTELSVGPTKIHWVPVKIRNC